MIHAAGIYPDQCAEPSKVDHCARHRKLHPALPTSGSWFRYFERARTARGSSQFVIAIDKSFASALLEDSVAGLFTQ